MAICDWPELERPREKLLQVGPTALSDVELLAIFLRTGIRGQSAVDLARLLIRDFGSVSHLLCAPLDKFISKPGLGTVKYTQLMAVRELAKRALLEEMQYSDILASPESVRHYLRLLIGQREIEVFVAIFLSPTNRILATKEIFSGTLTETRVYPREVVRHGLLANACSVIVAHNHPTGCAEPTAADIHTTQILKTTLQMVDIRLLDHFIVTESEAVSFSERGLV